MRVFILRQKSDLALYNSTNIVFDFISDAVKNFLRFNLTLVYISGHVNPVHTLELYFRNFNIILRSTHKYFE